MLKKARKLGSQSDHLFPNNIESPKSENTTFRLSDVERFRVVVMLSLDLTVSQNESIKNTWSKLSYCRYNAMSIGNAKNFSSNLALDQKGATVSGPLLAYPDMISDYLELCSGLLPVEMNSRIEANRYLLRVRIRKPIIHWGPNDTYCVFSGKVVSRNPSDSRTEKRKQRATVQWVRRGQAFLNAIKGSNVKSNFTSGKSRVKNMGVGMWNVFGHKNTCEMSVFHERSFFQLHDRRPWRGLSTAAQYTQLPL